MMDNLIDFAIWCAPRLIVWLAMSWYFLGKAIELDSRDENKTAVAWYIALVFLVFLPLCCAF